MTSPADYPTPGPAQVELASSLREGDVTKPVPYALPTFQASFKR